MSLSLKPGYEVLSETETGDEKLESFTSYLTVSTGHGGLLGTHPCTHKYNLYDAKKIR